MHGQQGAVVSTHPFRSGQTFVWTLVAADRMRAKCGEMKKQMSKFLLFVLVFLCGQPSLASAIVHLTHESFSFPFIDAPARFAVGVNSSGTCGALFIADPIHACSLLRNNTSSQHQTRFLLIQRGYCSFEDKVRNAQDSGFQAAIVYDNRDKKSSLVSMIGNSQGIRVHAVFISKAAGETLKEFARGDQGECCITPSLEEAAWTVLVISFISLLVIVSVLATFFFTRNRRVQQQGSYHQCPSLDRQTVEVLPCFIFNSMYRGGRSIAETCAICLEDYSEGESVRVLPCHHEFHASCVDSWLTKWGTVCPVCKHDMSTATPGFLLYQ